MSAFLFLNVYIKCQSLKLILNVFLDHLVMCCVFFFFLLYMLMFFGGLCRSAIWTGEILGFPEIRKGEESAH